jgi:crossover junction endodeoxyribonuclease RusA
MLKIPRSSAGLKIPRSSAPQAGPAAGLRLTLPWPARALWPNARPHWSSRSRAAAAQRAAARLLALDHVNRNGPPDLPPDGPLKLRITACPPSRRRWDDDGLIGALKSARDGLAEALGVDDVRFAVQPVVRMPAVQGGQVVLEIGG